MLTLLLILLFSPFSWRPLEDADDGTASGALLTTLRKHSAAVRGLEFNAFSPNLLASGGDDAELCIWDLANPAAPSLYPAFKVRSRARKQAQGGTNYALNRIVAIPRSHV